MYVGIPLLYYDATLLKCPCFAWVVLGKKALVVTRPHYRAFPLSEFRSDMFPLSNEHLHKARFKGNDRPFRGLYGDHSFYGLDVRTIRAIYPGVHYRMFVPLI